jgi:hypothetical protein
MKVPFYYTELLGASLLLCLPALAERQAAGDDSFDPLTHISTLIGTSNQGLQLFTHIYFYHLLIDKQVTFLVVPVCRSVWVIPKRRKQDSP